MAVERLLEGGAFRSWRPAFSSTNLDETRQATSRFYADHRLELTERETPFDARLYNRALGDISFNVMQYGAGVEIEPTPFEFFLVQKPLAGKALVRMGGREFATQTDTGAIVSGRERYSVVREPGTRSIAVKIERPALERHLAHLLGREVNSSLTFDPLMANSMPGQAAWWRLIDFVLGEASREDGMLSSPILRVEMQELVMTALLTAQPHNYFEALHQGESPAAPFYIRRAEAYILSNPEKPIGMADLIEVSGVSARSLQAGFRRFRDTTPLGFLRQERLQRARADLLSADPATTTVTDLALKWGFYHLGNFAARYRRKFGERPSETLRRSRASRLGFPGAVGG